ncbi:MAG: UDP-N-acetylglucosamine--LPS N-acetylglucosamine transferase [Methylococcaceae bacterium]
MSQLDHKKKQRALFVSSSGGHWIQMCRLKPAFEEYDVFYVSTDPSYFEFVGREKFTAVPDASSWSKLRLILLSFHVLYVLLRIRPKVVLSTGAAPGFFALFFAKQMGIKTIWVDSIANVDKISLSGLKVKRYADLWLTQWEHLSKPGGPKFYGAVV